VTFCLRTRVSTKNDDELSAVDLDVLFEAIMSLVAFYAVILLSLPALFLWLGFYLYDLRAGKDASLPNRPTSPVAMGCLGFVGGAACGGLSGLLLPPLYYQWANPQILRDAQWGMVYLASVPIGIGAGAIGGCVLSLLLRRK
jgi:hypothetical protein